MWRVGDVALFAMNKFRVLVVVALFFVIEMQPVWYNQRLIMYCIHPHYDADSVSAI